MLYTQIEFMDNNTVAAISDSGINFYAMKQIPEELGTVTYEGKVVRLAVGTESVLVCTRPQSGTGDICLWSYTTSGDAEYEKKITFEPDVLGIGGNYAWACADKELIIMSSSGRTVFSGESDRNILYLAEGNNKEEFLAVCSGYLETIKLKEKAE